MKLRHTLAPIASVGVAVGLLLLASRGGPGVSSDTVVYLEGARALARGAGYVAATTVGWLPLTHYPPLYSVVLAAVGTVSKDHLYAALYLNIALRAALLAIVWYGLRRIARVGPVSTGIALGFLAVSADLTDVHAMVWSEPLFFVLSVGALFFLAGHLSNRRRLLLAAASLLLAAAALTRYAGLGLLGAAPLLLLVRRERTWRDRLVDLGLYICVAAPPVLAWWLRDARVAFAFEDWIGESRRTLAFHLPSLQDWGAGASTVSLWLFPYSVPSVVGALVVLAGAGLLLALVVRRARVGEASRPSPDGLACARVLLVAAFSYLAFVVLARSVADAVIPFDGRMLSPAFVYLVIGVAAAFGSGELFGFRVKQVGAVVAALLIALLLRHGYYAAQQGKASLDYAGKTYARMAQEAAASQRTVAYSNDPFFLRFYFASPVAALPFRSNPFSDAANPRFKGEVGALCHDLSATGHTVFYAGAGQSRNPTLRELIVLGRLQILRRGTGWFLLGPGACG